MPLSLSTTLFSVALSGTSFKATPWALKQNTLPCRCGIGSLGAVFKRAYGDIWAALPSVALRIVPISHRAVRATIRKTAPSATGKFPCKRLTKPLAIAPTANTSALSKAEDAPASFGRHSKAQVVAAQRHRHVPAVLSTIGSSRDGVDGCLIQCQTKMKTPAMAIRPIPIKSWANERTRRLMSVAATPPRI